MATAKPWKVLDERLLHDGSPWLQLKQQTIGLPDGCTVDMFYQIEMRDFALVYATTETGHVIVLRLYRHGPRRIELALPGGLVDDGEESLIAAQRELLEETGYQAKHWRSLGRYTMNSNYGCGSCNLYMASQATRIAEPDSGDLEEAEILLVTPDELLQSLGRGEVSVIGHAAAIAMVTAAKYGFPMTDAE